MSDRIQRHRKPTTANVESSQTNSLSSPIQAAVIPAPTPSIAPTSTESDTASASETSLDPAQDPAQRSPYAFPGHDFSRIAIQPKLTVSQPDDPLEREADQVAQQVMRMPEPVSSAPVATGFVGHDFSQISVLPHLQPGQSRSPLQPKVQRQSKTGSFNAASNAASRSSTKPYTGHDFGQISIQPQQRVSRSLYPNSLNTDWIEETGGDRNAKLPDLAASVTPLVQRVALPEDDTETEGVEPETSPEAELELPIEAESPDSDSDSEAEDELVQTKPLLQRAASGQAKGTDIGASVGASLEQRLAQSQGTGSPLADETRGFMESRFGADFGSVRVHTDSSAVQLNKDLNAQAFTQGSDVYFGAGQSPGKNDLTAHELTHTLQQTGGPQAKTLSRRSNQDRASKYHLPIQPNLNLSTLQRKEAPPSSPETQTPPDSDDSKSAEPPAPGSKASPVPASPPTTDSATPAAEKPGTATAPPPGESKPEAPPTPEATAPTDPATEAGKSAPVAAAPAAGTATPKGAIEPSAAVPASEQAAATGKAAIGAEGKTGTVAAPGTALPGGSATTGDQAPSSSGLPNPSGGNAPTAPAPETSAKAGSPQSPQSDPDFKSVADRSKAVASQQKTHSPAGAKSAEAQAASVPPGNEVESKAQNRQVQEADQQKPGTFNAAAFKAALLEKIAAITPKSEDEAKQFKDSNQIDSVKQEVSSQVSNEQKQAATPIDQKVKEQPDTTGIEPKPVKPLEATQPGAPPTEIDAQKAAPKPKQEAEVSQPLQEGNQKIDQQMATANVTDEQLATSNEPQFVSALDAKKQTQAHANTAPAAYRQQEQQVVDQAQTQAQAQAQTHLQGMHGDRAQALQQVMGLQGETKGKDEQERSKVANDINAIYARTKTEVEGILSGLDSEVNGKFDAGAGTAKKNFEDYVGQKMDAYKEERYGKWYDATKWGNRIGDAFTGLPPEVNQFFVDGRQLYLGEMDKSLTAIADLVADKLNQAKQRVTQGKQEIQKYVAGLPQSLRQVGQDAAQTIQGKFDELDQSIDNKQNELIDSLAQKYQDNLKQLDDRIEQMKQDNKGLFDKAIDFISGVINTIVELGKMLASLLAKAIGALPKILQDPIGFLGNLVSGLKQGFQNFLGNIWEHLKQGLIGWLTGALGSAGIQMPENFDLKGIFTLVMQILGLVYDGIRSKAVKRLGEKTVNFLEGMFEPLMILKDEGIGGLWKFIQDQIGDLKAMVMDTLQNFVIETVIKQGIMWILSLLNPASAFVRACKALIDIVTFFIERGSQIMELVNAVLDAIIQVSSGAVDGAAKAVENALVKALPVVISFMASLLGLGGISEKIREIIEKVRKPIDKAIDWIIDKAVKFAKKIGKKLGFGKAKKGKGNKEEITDADKKKHAEYLTEISKSLKEDQSKGKTFEEFVKGKKSLAEQLRGEYQNKLKEGIKISASYQPLEEDKKDKVLDIKFRIHPNDNEKVIDIAYVEKEAEDTQQLKPQIRTLLDEVITEDYLNKLTNSQPGSSGNAMRPRYENFRAEVNTFLQSFDNEYAENSENAAATANEFLKKLKILKTVKSIVIDFVKLIKQDTGSGIDSPEEKLTAANKVFGKFSDLTWNGEKLLQGREFISISGNFPSKQPKRSIDKAAGVGNKKIEKTQDSEAKRKLQEAKTIASKYNDILILVPEDIPSQDPYRKQSFTDDQGQASVNTDNSYGLKDAERKFYSYLFDQIKTELGKKAPPDKNKEEFFQEHKNEVSGHVKMFSEMTPCDVCQTVDRLVKNWFSGIDVEIEFGVNYS